MRSKLSGGLPKLILSLDWLRIVSLKRCFFLQQTIYDNFYSIKLKPNAFPRYLVDEIGFEKVEYLNKPESNAKGTFNISGTFLCALHFTASNWTFQMPCPATKPKQAVVICS